jgi:hypothetical protein
MESPGEDRPEEPPNGDIDLFAHDALPHEPDDLFLRKLNGSVNDDMPMLL